MLVQVILPDGYLEAVYEEMRAEGALCIADEVRVRAALFTFLAARLPMSLPSYLHKRTESHMVWDRCNVDLGGRARTFGF